MSEVPTAFLRERFLSKKDKVAFISNGEEITYLRLLDYIDLFIKQIKSAGIKSGDVVLLVGDYSVSSIAALLGLIESSCIIVPLTPESKSSLSKKIEEVSPDWEISCVDKVDVSIKFIFKKSQKPDLYSTILKRRVPGLILFTSGSSGVPKAVVHDFSKLLEKFMIVRPSMITLNFLLFDHWGGLNTLLHAVSNLCLVVFPKSRNPQSVCELIEAHRIELLPTTPSFLNLLLISGAHKKYDLSSLRLISYGAEPMPKSTLNLLHKEFPDVDLRQTYGMIELGVLRSKSLSKDSLWVKIGGEGYRLRVVDGILQVRAESAMIGYINEPNPFTEDGYFITGDVVEQEGEWLKILGRNSDIINVGGQKVYPSEVEAAILNSPLVEDVMVYGENYLLTGKIVCADIVLSPEVSKSDARLAILEECNQTLQKYMIPMKIRFVDGSLQTARLKRMRTPK